MDIIDMTILFSVFNPSAQPEVSEEEAMRIVEEIKEKNEREWWNDPDLYE